MTNEETKKQNQNNCYACMRFAYNPSNQPICTKTGKRILQNCGCEDKHYSAEALYGFLEDSIEESKKFAEIVKAF